MANCAVETVLPPGVFMTSTPLRVASATSMLSIPTPARPITFMFVALAKSAGVACDGVYVWSRGARRFSCDKASATKKQNDQIDIERHRRQCLENFVDRGHSTHTVGQLPVSPHYHAR